MRIKALVTVPVVVMAIVIFTIFLPDLLGTPILTWSEKTNVMLTTVLAIFAGIEVYSANVKLKSEERNNAIKTASDELEKAYGPIYSMFNEPDMIDKETYNLPVYEKALLDQKIAAYRSMFPLSIVTFWEEKIRSKDSVMVFDAKAGARNLIQSNPNIMVPLDVCKIPLEFVKMFTDEYMKRSEKLRKLLAE